MIDVDRIFSHTTSIAIHVIRAALLTVLYAGLTLSLSGGSLGLLGVYLILVSGILPWSFPALYKQERILVSGAVAIIGTIQAIALLWVHPVLSTSVFFMYGNLIFNNGEKIEKYDAIGSEYWPASLLLVPFGLFGWVVSWPVFVILWLTDFISWISDLRGTTEQPGSEEMKDNSPQPKQSSPKQELETVQRSGPTAEDVNARRPDESKRGSTETGNSSSFEN